MHCLAPWPTFFAPPTHPLSINVNGIFAIHRCSQRSLTSSLVLVPVIVWRARDQGMRFATTTVVALLALSHSADTANIRSQRATYGSTSTDRDTGDRRLFPYLTRLRDNVIERVFGQHPTKDTSQSSPIESISRQYANQVVLRFNITSPSEEAALSKATDRLFLDVWAFNHDFVDIRLHSDEVAPLISLLPRSLQLSYSTLVTDLAAAVYESVPSRNSERSITLEGVHADLSVRPGAGDNVFFQDYRSLSVIIRWMQLLEVMFPAFVEYTKIGQSWEGRDIPALRVGVSGQSSSSSPRKTIVITGGLHGREWISTSTVNYLAWSFITSFGKEPMITKLLVEFDIVFIPVVNPDGFEYTWNVDRLWRKSRQQTGLRYCRGMDLDHAFGYEWDSARHQTDPCSESYGGEQPFQAVEAEKLAHWARNQTLHNVNFVSFIDLHSYSQQVLFPYAYSCAIEPPNIENLTELAAGIAKSIRLASGESYSVASACEGAVSDEKDGKTDFEQRIESGGGSAIDWFYHEMKAHFSYQIKLRDTGSYGFLLPREHIVPTGEEIFSAMKYFGDYLLGNNGIEKLLKEENGNGDDAANVASNMELRRRNFRR
ncbi:unnamed protein product [Clonostachys rosea f. rosea IK726]|jgi:extracellular matrix protein 14|uniref:Inactive metallocarboxypeptidase ECM14 n=2 Tax=Bionectria ochroleuca TaxID=29856 RepID=A0A0B7JR10_BIOOC|nr:unnamed protein product [Clonostachys rosea f. rosea IK726]